MSLRPGKQTDPGDLLILALTGSGNWEHEKPSSLEPEMLLNCPIISPQSLRRAPGVSASSRLNSVTVAWNELAASQSDQLKAHPVKPRHGCLKSGPQPRTVLISMLAGNQWGKVMGMQRSAAGRRQWSDETALHEIGLVLALRVAHQHKDARL